MTRKYTGNKLDEIKGEHGLPLLLILRLATIGMLLAFKVVLAEPYLPENETQILEYLPIKFMPLTSRVDKLLNKIKRDSSSDRDKEELINVYLQLAKSSGDTRYVSYAQSRLDQLLKETPESEVARLLSAQIQQYDHKFEESIGSLKSLLDDYPKNTQAWSLLANLQLLTGKYDAAKLSCKQLSMISTLTDVLICQSNIMIRTGELNKAFRILSTLSPVTNEMTVNQQLWLYTSLAEIKIQQNDYQVAEPYINQAMKLVEDHDINDAYLTRIFVDYLIQRNNLEEAFELVKNNNDDSGLMIRAAVLANRLGYKSIFNMKRSSLSQIFSVEKRRGQNRHLREQALFSLVVLNNSDMALKLAKKNWVLQKEPEDARILMKAVLTVGDREQIKQVEFEIAKTGLIDSRLEVTYLQSSFI